MWRPGTPLGQNENEFRLTLDFDNDRHHSLEIFAGDSAAVIKTKLLELAFHLEHDRQLQ